MMNINPGFNTPEDLRNFLNAFQKSRIILSAFELGVFNYIGDSGNTSADIALKAGADVRATDRLLNALVALGLLKKTSPVFFHTPFSSRYLDARSPECLHGIGHTAHIWHSWSCLTDIVRQGRSFRENASWDARSGWAEPFMAAMHERAAARSDEIAGLLKDHSFRRMLDAGGGTGVYAHAFLRKNPDMTAVILDVPDIIPISRRYAENAGLSDRIGFIEGDYLSTDPGHDYDLVLLSAVIHINSPEENAGLIARCASALNPGGILAIQDHVMNEDRTSPAAGAFFAINMLVGTPNGDTYTESEISGWMRAAGLKDLKKYPLKNNMLITGVKS